MLDNKLYIIIVVEFLRRSHVDRGTREGKVVVGTDLSKQKVNKRLSQSIAHATIKEYIVLVT
jgi:hypothetical protein